MPRSRPPQPSAPARPLSVLDTVHRGGWAACALCLLAASPASAADTPSALQGPPDGLGLGLQAGEPSGLAWALRSGDEAKLQGAVGWSMPKERIHISVDYVMDLQVFDVPDTAAVMPLYVGLGGRARVDGSRDESTGLGVRVPVGMAVEPQNTAVDIFLELAPGIGLFPATDFFVDGALGARVYFF